MSNDHKSKPTNDNEAGTNDERKMIKELTGEIRDILPYAKIGLCELMKDRDRLQFIETNDATVESICHDESGKNQWLISIDGINHYAGDGDLRTAIDEAVKDITKKYRKGFNS